MEERSISKKSKGNYQITVKRSAYFGRNLNLVIGSCHSEKVWMELFKVLLDNGRRVAFRVTRYEDRDDFRLCCSRRNFYRIVFGGESRLSEEYRKTCPRRRTQFLNHGRHLVELVGTNVWTKGVAKVDEHPLSTKVLVGGRVAIVISEGKRATNLWLARRHVLQGLSRLFNLILFMVEVQEK